MFFVTKNAAVRRRGINDYMWFLRYFAAGMFTTRSESGNVQQG